MYALHYPLPVHGARQRHHVEHEKCRGVTHISQNTATEFLQVLLQNRADQTIEEHLHTSQKRPDQKRSGRNFQRNKFHV